MSPKLGEVRSRQFVEALHREGTRFYHQGHYESAMILYNKAEKLRPWDKRHNMASSKAIEAINSSINPPPGIKKLLSLPNLEIPLAAILSPETAASVFEKILKDNPSAATIEKLLRYLDGRKDFWRLGSPAAGLGTSEVTIKRITRLALNMTRDLERSLARGKLDLTFHVAQELAKMADAFLEPHRYHVIAYNFITLASVAQGRHDRAVDSVTKMIISARKSRKLVLKTQALVTLGIVHLTFGHLDAAAKAWESLVNKMADSVPRAWTWHEIGRSYLETGKYSKALEASSRCLESATTAGTRKWLLHGKLLRGQALVKLGRFGEAMETLNSSARITEKEGDGVMLVYIKELLGEVGKALRKSQLKPINRDLSGQGARGLRQGTDFDKKGNEQDSGQLLLLRKEGRKSLEAKGTIYRVNSTKGMQNDEFNRSGRISTGKSKMAAHGRPQEVESSFAESIFEETDKRFPMSISARSIRNVREGEYELGTSRTQIIRRDIMNLC
ncbi:tetratricopeptide repeat protein 25-like [Orussus abietinus]|uniref:tetratricopeptide repeat protein 25-like n=1 Tax=Orussus abietinus TaxID=222816 RepID=UPI00062618AB|nr:tetratricopeptide repeat protein 25-like [Orussus abietinus]